jgi:membrane protein involved in colicin uptake
MGYFETRHQRNSAKITTLITIILLLLLFVVGMPFMDPPIEYGVAVNFGTSNVGSGNKPKAIPVKAPTKSVVKEATPTPVKPQKVEAPSKAEEVMTNESEESIAIKKQKEAEALAKAEAERLEREQKEAEKKKLREEQEKRKRLDDLIGGVKNSRSEENGGEGPDKTAGNKGQLDGNPYAPSYFGNAGTGKGGVGYGLNGRGAPRKEIYKQDCNEYGLVVVEIKVNRNGDVISAEPGVKGTTNAHPCLIEPAKKIALSHKWPSDPKAPAEQIGFVSINFEVRQ